MIIHFCANGVGGYPPSKDNVSITTHYLGLYGRYNFFLSHPVWDANVFTFKQGRNVHRLSAIKMWVNKGPRMHLDRVLWGWLGCKQGEGLDCFKSFWLTGRQINSFGLDKDTWIVKGKRLLACVYVWCLRPNWPVTWLSLVYPTNTQQRF